MQPALHISTPSEYCFWPVGDDFKWKFSVCAWTSGKTQEIIRWTIIRRLKKAGIFIWLLTHENLGSPVPESFDFVCESLDRHSEGPGESEVSDFDVAFLVDQHILRLEVSVNDSSGGAEIESIENLVHVKLSNK